MPLFLRQSLCCFPALVCQAAGPLNFGGGVTLSVSHLSHKRTGITKAQGTCPYFTQVWDLNSGSHACTTSSLLTEPPSSSPGLTSTVNRNMVKELRNICLITRSKMLHREALGRLERRSGNQPPPPRAQGASSTHPFLTKTKPPSQFILFLSSGQSTCLWGPALPSPHQLGTPYSHVALQGVGQLSPQSHTPRTAFPGEGARAVCDSLTCGGQGHRNPEGGSQLAPGSSQTSLVLCGTPPVAEDPVQRAAPPEGKGWWCHGTPWGKGYQTSWGTGLSQGGGSGTAEPAFKAPERQSRQDGTFRYWAALCTLQLWLCRAAWHSSVVTPCTMACSWAYPPISTTWAHSSGSLRPLPFTSK